MRRPCGTTTRRGSVNIWSWSSMRRANRLAPISRITFWKRREWWARLRMNETFIFSISSQRLRPRSIEVSYYCYPTSFGGFHTNCSHVTDNFGIQQPQSYLYTSRSKCFDVQGIDDASDFAETLEAMRIIGLTQ